MSHQRDLDDLKWLVANRSKIQDLLLELYQFDQGQGLTEAEREGYHNVFGYLVGAAFSLWRAVFLSFSNRTMRDVTGNATELLKLVIETNTITFTQDINTASWMVGYYINNAMFRINAIFKDQLAWNILSDVASAGDRELLEQLNPDLRDHVSKTSILQEWEDAYNGLTRCLSLLRQVHSRRPGLSGDS